MPHLHLSLQSGDDTILKRMKRRQGARRHRLLPGRGKTLRPDIVLAADIIAGVPTETRPCSSGPWTSCDECGLSLLHVSRSHPARERRRPGCRPGFSDVVKDGPEGCASRPTASRRISTSRWAGRTESVLTENGGWDASAVHPGTAGQALPAGSIVEVTIAGHDGRELQAA